MLGWSEFFSKIEDDEIYFLKWLPFSFFLKLLEKFLRISLSF
jgi:hypothetical protein